MELSRADALSRTTRLLNEQLLGGGGDCDRIASLLANFTVRLVADGEVVATRAGQELILAANLLIRRMGMALHVQMPDASLIASAPPYEGASLHQALRTVEDELIPATRFAINAPAAAQVTFVLGTSFYESPEPAFRVGVSDLCATLRPVNGDPDVRFDPDSVIAALVAAGCVASQSLRAFLPTLSNAFRVEIRSHSAELGHTIEIDLKQLFPDLREVVPTEGLGRVDFISAGAITNASLYTLLRMNALKAGVRVIDSDDVDLSNLNRYMLGLVRHLGELKIRILERFGTRCFTIVGEPVRFDHESRSRLLPLAPRVLVGVDHVRSRWAVQREQPRWSCVGATEGFDAFVSSHEPGQPCAGCLHPFPNDDREQVVPTISFVSFFAGLLQALALLAEANGAGPREQVRHCMAFGWQKPVVVRMPLAAQARCPVCGGAASSTEAA